jgi:hypothetical protein
VKRSLFTQRSRLARNVRTDPVTAASRRKAAVMIPNHRCRNSQLFLVAGPAIFVSALFLILKVRGLPRQLP